MYDFDKFRPGGNLWICIVFFFGRVESVKAPWGFAFINKAIPKFFFSL